jgi:hypothetical protein
MTPSFGQLKQTGRRYTFLEAGFIHIINPKSEVILVDEISKPIEPQRNI